MYVYAGIFVNHKGEYEAQDTTIDFEELNLCEDATYYLDSSKADLVDEIQRAMEKYTNNINALIAENKY